jgi:non-ribosomal peptide synthetase component F
MQPWSRYTRRCNCPRLGWIQFHVDRDLPAALSALLALRAPAPRRLDHACALHVRVEPDHWRPSATCSHRTASRYPDRLAVASCHQGKRLTWAELSAEADRVARGLWSLGIRRGDRVGSGPPTASSGS